MNKTSTELFSLEAFVSTEQALEMAKIAGFDCYNYDLCHIYDYDYQTNKAVKKDHPLATRKYKKHILHIREVADKLGIECNQTHAPFPIDNKKILKAQKKAVIATKLLGAKIMVIHPDSFKNVGKNAVILRKIGLLCAKHGIKLAIENTWNWSGTHAIFAVGATPESLRELIDKINLPNVGACLDTGHAELLGGLASSVGFVNILKDKLFALHIHDNDLKNDKHQIPFVGSIDFDAFAKALKENNYQGELTLEAIYYYKTNPEKGQEMVNNLFEAVDKLNKMVNK